MKTYRIEYTAKLTKRFEVEAESPEEARETAIGLFSWENDDMDEHYSEDVLVREATDE